MLTFPCKSIRSECDIAKVAKDQEENLKEQTGIQPSLSEEDMKEYLVEVLHEVRNLRETEVMIMIYHCEFFIYF